MLDSSPVRISYLGPDLTVRFANKAYRESHSEIEGTIIGKHIRDLYDAELFESFIDYFIEAANGTPQDFNVPMIYENNSCVFNTKLVPNFNDDGSPNGIFAYCTDQTEQTLTERSFDSVLNGVPGRVCLVDRNYNVLFANDNLRAHYPTASEQSEFRLSDMLKEANWELAKKNIELAFTGQHVRYRDQFTSAQGEQEVLSIYLTPTRTIDHSAIEGVYILALDETELTETKSQLQRAERNVDLALKSQLVAFWELYPSREDWILTEHIERLLGLSKGNLKNSIGQLLQRVHPSDRGHVLYDIAAEESQAESYANEFRCRTATGEYRWFRLIGNREINSAGETLSLAGTIADINELKNAEILAAGRLKYRDSFLSMLSHELRNPVAGIQYAIDIFSDDSDALAGLSPQCRTSLAIVKRQTSVISRLLNDLLNVSRVSQNQILFEEEILCFSELLQEVVESAKSIYTKKDQSLSLCCDASPKMIKGDRVRLTQAFTNLIDNASKFSSNGNPIKVCCCVEDDFIVTRVCDSGHGIAPAAVSNIFDLFFQEEQPLDRKAGGLGIGLYLVKKIVDAHGGSVSVVSPGEIGGCEFEIRLPMESSATNVPPATSEKSDERLILVEDNEDSRLALSMALQSRGFDVTTFEDGQKAVDQIPNLTPKIVLIDIGLPGKDGLKVIRELRQHKGLNNTFFVALTGYGQKHEREMILTAGFDNHLVKPVDISELCSIISRRGMA